ncbi:MAG: hypothetical protein JWR37_428 [Mycobacterium sp.]|jgi:lysophospholipase L1-like esterase|nr:hypothetical protein [Mycobacterium sp.]
MKARLRASQIATVVVAVLLVAATAMTTLALTRDTSSAPPATPNNMIRVAVIGDSYSSGLGNNVVWPSLLAGSADLSISNVAFPGAGYVGGTGESGPFAGQIDKALASKPDIIVVFGGINDVGKSKELITQSAIDLFAGLTRRAPTARLIVLGPLWHEDPAEEAFYALDSAVNQGADDTHTTYISLIRETWLVGDGLIQSDGIHPTDEGQSILARQFGPVLLREIRQRDNGVRP